jgi:hypothetical protein
MTILASCQSNRQSIESHASGRRYREERTKGIERRERDRAIPTLSPPFSSLKHTVLSNPARFGRFARFTGEVFGEKLNFSHGLGNRNQFQLRREALHSHCTE